MTGGTTAADLDRCRLYGILDLGYVAAADVLHVAAAMIEGGVDIMQLRAKKQNVPEIRALAAELHRLTSPAKIPLVINDHPQIAAELGLEGVHVGQDDLSITEARALTGATCFIGKSTHSPAQAELAAKESADYIGFGPLFATPTKPDYNPIGLQDIAAVHKFAKLPIFCIGGIKLENLSEVIVAGAQRVVIVSGLLQARDVAEYARACKALLSARPIPGRTRC